MKDSSELPLKVLHWRLFWRSGRRDWKNGWRDRYYCTYMSVSGRSVFNT